jgi:excisionase family DNA binding protein
MNQPKLQPYVPYMTCAEVAHYLRVDLRTVHKWARGGQVPCYKLGNKYRFRLHEIDEWIEKKKQKCRISDGKVLL